MPFEVTILGINAALPARNRHMTAQFVQVGNTYLLIDCAEGTQYQLNNFGLKAHKIEHLFISHLHADHYLGLPGLLASFSLQNRTKPLHIYAPAALEDFLEVNKKISGGYELPFPLHFHPHPEEEYVLLLENKHLEVYSLPLEHRVFCRGFLVKEKQGLRKLFPEKLPEGLPFSAYNQLKMGADVQFEGNTIAYKEVTAPPVKPASYAFCSDTSYSENLLQYIKGIDVLYHEATFSDTDETRATETGHSTARQAATLGKKAGAKQVILGHFSIRYANLEHLAKEALQVHPNALLGEEGKTYTIG